MQKKSTLILIVVFALLLVGAVILYRTLGSTISTDLPTLDQNVAGIVDQDADTNTNTNTNTNTDPAPAPDTDEPAPAPDTGSEDEAESESDNSNSDSQSNPNAVPAPDITLYHLDGTAAQFSDYVGKPIVLNFWSSNCGPCRTEMPDFQTAYEQLGDKVQFLMVNVTDNYWDTLETASTYVAEENFTFPVLYDLDNHAAYTYGITGLPTTYFINASGNLVAYRSGMMDLNILMSGIDLIYQP